MYFILYTVAKSLLCGDEAWFMVPSQFYLKPVTTHPQLCESCAILCHLNPLTTDDAFQHRQILATRYKLAQSILKIGSALAERVGKGRWVGTALCLTEHGGSYSCL